MTRVWCAATLLAALHGVARADEPARAPDGASLYGVYCASCHGAEGDGMGAAGKMLRPRPASFVEPTFWDGRDDLHLKTVITRGGASVGRSALMAPFGSQLDGAAVDAVVSYLRQRFGPSPTVELDTEEVAPAEEAEAAPSGAPAP